MRAPSKTSLLSRFELSLQELKAKSSHSISIEAILKTLSGKGKTLLLICLCLPFGQILGLAFVFGLFIAFLGFKLAFYNSRIWLPHSIVTKKIPGKIMKKILSPIIWALGKLRSLTHTRIPCLWKSKKMQRVNGCFIGILGISLAFSLPIPFSSMFAISSLFFVSLGLLNDDGGLVAISYLIGFVYIAFVVVTLIYF